MAHGVYFLLRNMKCEYIIGIDEVGRGSLAGPLCVGACLVRRRRAEEFLSLISGVKDSKQLTPSARVEWFKFIQDAAERGTCEWRTTFVGRRAIDERGLAHALHGAIARALRRLSVHPRLSLVLLDGGIKAPRTFVFQRTIINGDETEPLIAVASIMAKVRRDRYMVRLSRAYPAYGFERHKGYGTKAHYEALRKHGVSEVHRKSFLKKFQAPSTKFQTDSFLSFPRRRETSLSGSPFPRG